MQLADKAKDRTVVDFKMNNGWMIITSYNVSTECHRHIGIQISLSLQANKLRMETGAHRYEAFGLIVDSGVRHKMYTENMHCMTLIIEPTFPGVQLLSCFIQNRNMVCLSRKQSEKLAVLCFRAMSHPGHLDVATVIAILNSDFEYEYYPDVRIQKAILFIDSLETKKISSQSMSKLLCLSEGRFLHLFKSNTGTNFRRYLLWKKLQGAIFDIGSDMSLTELAIGHGFADSSHFCRTCREMFGVTPSCVRQFIRQSRQLRKHAELTRHPLFSNTATDHAGTDSRFSSTLAVFCP
ncbi:AraC family transcriptional regulator [Vibrio quintilis]|uniref:DNA-binding transcriptional regulator AraC n=1 Tax=Vibrio quintilis TaxID=1117707 RepID=A0A1M7YVV9_9VIBR|nr:AraC family transcriptional regulator [Vibrio quintilis]SHO56626.1 DNA-binding transcriptional regulator AraC [Vibrio quintilis]